MARLDKTRRARVQKTFPPLRCSANCTDGTPCEKWATVGTTVCHTHGAAAKHIRATAEKRVSLAEAMVSGDKRPPHEVLEDALHAADLLMREVVLDMRGGTVTPALLDRFVAAFERAHRMAKVNLDAGIDQRRMRLAEAQATQMHAVFTRVLSGLGLTQEQKALVPHLLKREIAGVLNPRQIEGTAA